MNVGALHAYTRGLLDDPDVAIDTNHLERALRVIPIGRKNWLFSWTELGAKHVGIVQSLLVTCRLHDIDPYDYFVDVLQRVGRKRVARPPRILWINCAHSLALTTGDECGEGRSEMGVLDKAN